MPQKTLKQIHASIVKLRDFVDIGVTKPIADPNESPEKMAAINEAAMKLREQINDFDCLFHDLFDCR